MADIYLKKLSMMILFDNYTVRQIWFYQFFQNQKQIFYLFFSYYLQISDIIYKKIN